MRRTIYMFALALTLRTLAVSDAAVVVNPPRAITHQVSVQMIQTAPDNGSSPAPLFGDPTRAAAIQATVDSIWAQAGIDVQFLPNVVRYNNTFAYQGVAGAGVRPIGDLPQIVNNAQAHGGILNPNPAVLNMFFVNVVPGSNPKDANWVNGVGHVGANGIAMFVGSNVSADLAGHWVAHEIGHNLGLSHATAGTANLMTASRNTELLIQEQIGALLQSALVKPLSAPIAGDYDRNGIVDASDYVLWRNTFRSRKNLAADGDGNGIVGNRDLTIWRNNFGRGVSASAQAIATAGFAAAGDLDGFDRGGSPEPTSMALIVLGTSIVAIGSNRRRCAHP
jgi:hypothetical protein